MSTPAVGSTGSSSSSTSTSGANNTDLSSLGPNAFLSLLTTQLQNQDPLNPIDDTQSIAELAQFSQLQASTNLATSFTAFQQNFGVVQSASLLGKSVTVAGAADSGDNSTSASGVVSGVTITNGTPSFTLKDASGNAINDPTSGKPQTFTASQIVSISG